MGKFQKLFILIGVFAVICTAAIIISRLEERKEQIKNSGDVILNIDSSSVTALSWQVGDTSLEFHKDEKWLYDNDEAFPTSEDKILSLLKQFEDFAAAFVIDDVEDLGQYGLDKPVCTINITSGDTGCMIELGEFSTMDSQRYVSIGDGKVYLVNRDPFKSFDIELSDMIKHDEIPDLSNAAGLKFTGTENYEIVYEEDSTKTYCSDDVYFTENKPLDTTEVTAYLKSVMSLSLTDYASYNATLEDLHNYGLDTPELTVLVEYPKEKGNKSASTETFVLNIGRDREKLKAAEQSGDENAVNDVTAYARVGESQIVYRISSQSYKALTLVSYNHLRHKNVFTASVNDIVSIDISLDGQKSTLSSEINDGAKIWRCSTDDEVDISDFAAALTGLRAENSDSFTEEAPSQKEEIGLIVHLDNDNYPQVEISLYRYNGNYCLAGIDGKTIARIPRSRVVTLIESVNAIVLEQ